ncbi:MAG: hypothetical protein O3A20_03600 [Planctomycetota bacterium]|nr:hypothetical protein [Planctomycetota bacterium]
MIRLALILACAPAQQQAADNPCTQVGREEALAGALAWLVASQNEDGSWGSHHSPRPIEVLCDVPGSHDAFRIATTALCVMALEHGPPPGVAGAAARDRGVDALLAGWDVKRPSGLEHYTVWAFGFGMQALGEHLLAHPDDPRAPAIREACAAIIAKLGQYQHLDGGWGYLSLDEVPTFKPSFTSMSFTTATVLIGLDRARAIGVAAPDPMLKLAVDSIARCETPERGFGYGELWRMNPGMGVNRLKGAACRGPACYEAMQLFGRATRHADGVNSWRVALAALLEDHARFQVAGLRRPMPHESHYQISGYFYLYGHYYAALLLQRLSAEDRARFAPELDRAVMICRQPDGSFWDYPLYSYHSAYGTAFAALTLAMTAPIPEK